MSHIHTEAGQHDLTASAYIIRLDLDEPSLVLHFHKKLKKYLQFGGHVELDETPWDTVKHELLEESGYHLDQLRLLQPHERLTRLSQGILHPVPVVVNTHVFEASETKHSHTDLAYAFITSEEPRSDIGEGESAQMRLCTRAEVEALADDEIPPGVREIALFVFDTIVPRWEAIDPLEYS